MDSHVLSVNFERRLSRQFNEEESSTNGAGTTGYPQVEDEVEPFTHTIQKQINSMDCRLKCKS